MVEYIYNGKPITGVYCSDMRDMLLVKKDAFKHMYDRLQTLEKNKKTRREQRIKEIQSGVTESATQQLIIMAKLEELRQENEKLREQLALYEHDNMALSDANNGFLVELNEHENKLAEMQKIRQDNQMFLEINQELTDKVDSLESTISELQEKIRLSGREPVEVARDTKEDIAFRRAAEVLVMAIRGKKSVCDIVSEYKELKQSRIYSILSVKKDDDYERLMEIYRKESSYFYVHFVTEETFKAWYCRERKNRLHLHTGAELEKKLGAGYSSIKGVLQDPTTGYYKLDGVVLPR